MKNRPNEINPWARKRRRLTGVIPFIAGDRQQRAERNRAIDINACK